MFLLLVILALILGGAHLIFWVLLGSFLGLRRKRAPYYIPEAPLIYDDDPRYNN